jgi:hypothetical protein
MPSQRSSKLSHEALISPLLEGVFVENTKVGLQHPPKRTRAGGNDSPHNADNADSASKFSDMAAYGNEYKTIHPERRQLASSSWGGREHAQFIGEPSVMNKLWEALSRVEEDIKHLKQTGPFRSIPDVQKRRCAVSEPSSNSSDGLVSQVECEDFENATKGVRAVSPFHSSIKETSTPSSSSLRPTMSFHSNSKGKEMWECVSLCFKVKYLLGIWFEADLHSVNATGRIRSRKRDAKDLLTHASVARWTLDMDSARNVESSRSRGLGS